jgi:hypothetical protein
VLHVHLARNLDDPIAHLLKVIRELRILNHRRLELSVKLIGLRDDLPI